MELIACCENQPALKTQTSNWGRDCAPSYFFLLLTFYRYREGLVTRFGFDSIE
jgi:hypothetical protein